MVFESIFKKDEPAENKEEFIKIINEALKD